MPATDSFTSVANGVSGTTATRNMIYSLISVAPSLSGAVAKFTDPVTGTTLLSRHGFAVRSDPAGVFISRAPTFGGTQVALTFPLSRYDAQELAQLILTAAG